MFRRISIVFLIAFSFYGETFAQNSWWVFFTDKNGTTFNPYTYFAPEAIVRREKLGISLTDSTDFPVNENYLLAVGKIADQMGYSTRWFNGVGVEATETEVESIRKLPFVREVVPQFQLQWNPACYSSHPDSGEDLLGNPTRDVNLQIDPLQGKLFAQHQLTGQGIIISIIDVGFHGVDTHPAFSDLRFNNRIRSTFDFARNELDVYGPAADHGSMVLSSIAGKEKDKQLGLAPDATFLLAKISTSWTNQKHGEENFVAAMEWSDKQGAMLINCSDGPDYVSYFPEQMNGRVPLMSRASNLAARKGMLVVAAAGNEGESNSPVLLPPADADSVLSVTATNDEGYIADYSSYGPPPDFRRKPDVCAPGTVLGANGANGYEEAEGTSFSAPLLVGFAACLIQKYPDLSPMMLADSMRRSGSLYPYYDYAHGYGVPQASYFFDSLKVHEPTFTIARSGNEAVVNFEEKYKPICGADHLPKFYYSLEDQHGRIYKYTVFELINGNSITIPEEELKSGTKINVFYEGYYGSLQL